MVTYDAFNVPVSHGAQATFQASAIRWGRTFGVPRGEFWTTLGGDVSIPLGNSVRRTLQRKYAQVHLYVEGARRANSGGMPGRNRNFLTEAGELIQGPWQVDLSATQRWTTDPLVPTQQDRIYTGTIGRSFASQSTVLLSVARERVADRTGVYAGIRLVQTLTSCSRCASGRAY